MIRNAVVNGSFYPSNSSDLSGVILSYLDEDNNTNVLDNVKGLISPHAGYIYSGKTAGIGFNSVKNKVFDTVIILSPSHHISFKGVSIFNGLGYETPLGVVDINTRLLNQFKAESSLIQCIPDAHEREHGIEVQLPFLQEIYKEKHFSILPIVFGDKSGDTINTLSQLIITHCDPDNTLIIASSDMSHFYTYDKAKEMDLRALQYLKNGNINGLKEKEVNRDIEFCGFAPILVLLDIMKVWNCSNVDVLDYCNSGDITGDHSRVVGYGSVVYSKKGV